MSFVLSVQPAILPPRIFLHESYQTSFFYRGCLFIFFNFLNYSLYVFIINFITKLLINLLHYYFYYYYLYIIFYIKKEIMLFSNYFLEYVQ